MTALPIEDYGLLSDRNGAALVGRDGSVDWLCAPRFDSPSVFGALLDPEAGHWSVRPEGMTPRYPEGEAATSRRYLPGTLALRTDFRTATGTLHLTDALATGPAEDPHRLGAAAPHLLIRSVNCSSGEVPVALAYRPRPEYGRVVPVLRPVEGGLRARGGPAALALSCPVPLRTSDAEARATLRLRAGETVHLGLHIGALSGPRPRLFSQEELENELIATVGVWRAWSDLHQGYEGPWRDQVLHSGRVLYALSYQPTGAIAAAATASLPEDPGGERNWDYRYSWVRDAAFSADALGTAACRDEAGDFFGFMTDAAATDWPRTHLQIVYGVGGERDLTERELPHLSGWRDSRPVRIGNGAWEQPQLDVYGELLETAARFAGQLDTADDEAQRVFLADLVDAAAARWGEPDHGVWEVRGEPRHFLHSKLMCWVALDRGLRLADRIGASPERADTWRAARDEVRAAILERGWNGRVGAYTQSFGSTALDASVLMLPLTGFLPAADPRVLSTLDAVGTQLTDSRGLVRRYATGTGVDGLPGDEGSFLLCTFWLAQAQARAGRTAQARATFERAAGYANDLGLLAEQAGPEPGRLLGNFPQALSHIGLINAAAAIGEAERR